MTKRKRTITLGDFENHAAICRRFEDMADDAGNSPTLDRLTRMMDLERVAELIDVDWAALLAAKHGDFMHDVVGIHNHMDRSTGKLTDCFHPRHAR